MSEYTDSKDRKWTFRFAVPTFIKVCRKMNLTLQRVISMDIPLADALEALPILLEGQIKDAGITPDIFLAEMAPSDMAKAMKALGESIKEAFPEIAIKGGGAGNLPFDLGGSMTSTSLPQSQE